MILLSSLSESYDHIVTTMLYGNQTLILKGSHQLSYLIRLGKYQIKRSRKDRVWWSREEKEEEKKEKVQPHQRRVTFVTGKVIERMTVSIGKSG